jgi:hypothetical protein
VGSIPITRSNFLILRDRTHVVFMRSPIRWRYGPLRARFVCHARTTLTLARKANPITRSNFRAN